MNLGEGERHNSAYNNIAERMDIKNSILLTMSVKVLFFGGGT